MRRAPPPLVAFISPLSSMNFTTRAGGALRPSSSDPTRKYKTSAAGGEGRAIQPREESNKIAPEKARERTCSGRRRSTALGVRKIFLLGGGGKLCPGNDRPRWGFVKYFCWEERGGQTVPRQSRDRRRDLDGGNVARYDAFASPCHCECI